MIWTPFAPVHLTVLEASWMAEEARPDTLPGGHDRDNGRDGCGDEQRPGVGRSRQDVGSGDGVVWQHGVGSGDVCPLSSVLGVMQSGVALSLRLWATSYLLRCSLVFPRKRLSPLQHIVRLALLSSPVFCCCCLFFNHCWGRNPGTHACQGDHAATELPHPSKPVSPSNPHFAVFPFVKEVTKPAQTRHPQELSVSNQPTVVSLTSQAYF